MRCFSARPWSVCNSAIVWEYVLLYPYPCHAKKPVERTITPMPIPNLNCFFTGTLLLLPHSLDAFDSITGKRPVQRVQVPFSDISFYHSRPVLSVSPRKHQRRRAILWRSSACQIHRARTVF